MSKKQEEEEIVMTPLNCEVGQVMKMVRVSADQLDKETVQHIGGGQHKGIIIKKAASEKPDPDTPHTTRNFACYITDPKSKKKNDENLVKEKRQLRFWFKPNTHGRHFEKTADSFFQQLIDPHKFPKDYIGYLIRVLKIMRTLPELSKMELEMRPPRPGEDDDIHLVRRQVTHHVKKTRVTKTHARKGQEDQLRLQDGQYVEGGDMENGHNDSSSVAMGASLDRSARRGQTQEDYLRQAGRYDAEGGYIEGSGVDYLNSPQGAEMARLMQNGRLGSSQEDHLRQQGMDSADGQYIGQSEAATNYAGALYGDEKWKMGSTQEDHLKLHGREAGVTGQLQSEHNTEGESAGLMAGDERWKVGLTQEDLLKQQARLGAEGGYVQTSHTEGESAGLMAGDERWKVGSTQEDLLKQQARLGAEGGYVQTSHTEGESAGLMAGDERWKVGLTQEDLLKQQARLGAQGGYVQTSHTVTMTREEFSSSGRPPSGEGIKPDFLLLTQGPGATTDRVEPIMVSETSRIVRKTYNKKHGERFYKAVLLALRAEGIYPTGYQSQTSSSQDNFLSSTEVVSGSRLDGTSTSLYYSRNATPHGSARDQPRRIPLSKRGQIIIWIAKKQRLLNTLEDAYPNIVRSDDLIKLSGFKRSDMMTVVVLLNDLKNRGLISEVESGRWMRIQTVTKVITVEEEGVEVIQTTRTNEVEIVQNIPILSGKEQPTIAIITLLYCEKLAVDAMMDFKTTYVKYKTEGEGQVYTVGNIGKQKVVSTKLSKIGYGEGEQIAAGNYVTRLLGTFSKVEFVILVGCGGGVINMKDDSQHVRLGDIVVSKPDFSCGPLYIACSGVDTDSSGGASFSTQNWNSRQDDIEKIINDFQKKQQDNWREHLEQGFKDLEGGETRFFRPPPETDRFYIKVDGELQEVPHPEPAKGSFRDEHPDEPIVHYGTVGAGKILSKSKNESLRQDFSLLNSVKVLDPGFHAVMDSIDGNRKDCFSIIRGIADYKDGTRKREWQPYAALVAASYMKSLILAFPIEEEDY